MRILLTGAHGQLGSELCKFLGYETLVPKDLPGFDLAGRNIEEEVLAASPDLIIHAGAYTDVDGAEREPDRAMAVNAKGTEQIVKAAVRLGARMVYISTDYVFDGNQKVPYREDDRPHPINQYGLTKWKGEQVVLASRVRALVIRTAWLYGSVGRNFVKSIMCAARTESVLRVVNDQCGCPTYVEDLTSALMALVRQDVTGIIHVTNRGQCTWFEFAQTIIREMGLPCSVLPITTEQAGRLAKRPHYSVLSSERVASFGLVLPEWREALTQFVKQVQIPTT